MSEEEKQEEVREQDHCCCGHHHEGGCCHHQEESAATEPGQDEIPDLPLKTPTLVTLTTNLATQAMVSMGMIPNPMTGKCVFLLNQAKHLIDTVQLIYDKTEGNRTAEETKTLDSVIHELHMLFLAAQEEKTRRDQEKK